METGRPAAGEPPGPAGSLGSDAERPLGDLLERATEIAGTQRKLELLMEANRSILGQLSLETVLEKITSSACELVEARYGALGVLGPDGQLEEFIHVGVEDDVVARIGSLPTGAGLLGVLADDPYPLRLDRISDDPRQAGFPEHHPTMESFLGVPIRVRDVVYGNLYLTERIGGGGFTAQDQTILAALAVTAGMAIENARLYEDSQRRQHWAEAAAAVSSALIDPTSGTDPVALVADTVMRLTKADALSVVVPATEPGMFRVQLARGVGAKVIEGLRYPKNRSVAALALATGRGIRIAAAAEQQEFAVHLRRVLDVGAVLGLPLHGSVTSHGALVVARRRERPTFDATDLELSESFAAQAAIAMELAEARADQQRLLVLQDRQRIARDLHDHVIQRLFASGLSLQGLSAAADPATAARLMTVVDDLDMTIQQIRTLIFRLQAPGDGRGLRATVLEIVEEAAPVLGFAPDVGFEGPVDTVTGEELDDEVAAVTREALSNVVRHARATWVAVQVVASVSALTLTVVDDGVGPGEVTRRSGLRNLEERARHYGGTCELVPGEDGGTVLRWSIPLG